MYENKPLSQKFAAYASYIVFISPISLLFLAKNTHLPFILGKTLLFRAVIEVALILYVLALSLDRELLSSFINRVKQISRIPLAIGIAIFTLSAIISSIFAVSPFRSFWGTIERGDGLFDLAHVVIFFLLTLLLFTEKTWKNFLTLHVVVGAIFIFYGLLQYWGVEKFPFALEVTPRPRSYAGNPAMLSTYLVLLTAVTTTLFQLTKNRTVRIITGLVTAGALITVVLAGARSAMVGLAAGALFLVIYYLFKGGKRLKISAVVLLIAIVITGASLLTVPESQIWQRLPGIERIAQTVEGGLDSSSLTRLRTWRMSWEMVKERPIFGWGLENYIFGWAKYFDPLLSSSAWLDKAHNKTVEVAVQQGMVGAISYVSMMALFFVTLWRNKERITRRTSAFVSAVVIAYLVHSMFLFDDVNSYIPLFSIFGWMAAQAMKGGTITGGAVQKKITMKAVGGLSLVLIALGLYSIYAFHFTPLSQAAEAKAVRELIKVEAIQQKLATAFQPYNYAQHSIRGSAIDYYYDRHPEVFEDPKFENFYNFTLETLDDTIKRESYDDVRMFIRKSQIADAHATGPKDAKIAESAAREALKLAPTRQEVHYSLVRALMGQERFEEAQEAARAVIALEPNDARSHLHLMLAYAFAGEEFQDEAEEALERAMQTSTVGLIFTSGNANNIAITYLNWGRGDKLAQFALKETEMNIAPQLQLDYYYIALQYFLSQRNKEAFIAITKTLEKFPELRDDAGALRDLAEKEKWEILESLQ
jgi:O-antigen ligase